MRASPTAKIPAPGNKCGSWRLRDATDWYRAGFSSQVLSVRLGGFSFERRAAGCKGLWHSDGVGSGQQWVEARRGNRRTWMLEERSRRMR